MGRTPHIPAQLKKRPFSLDDAIRVGLTKSSLRGKSWRRLGAELYCWSGLAADSWMVLAAWQRQLPPGSVFAGRTAAWLLGLDFDPSNPIELIVPPSSGVRSRPGLDVRRCDIPRTQVVKVRGLRATSVHRTLSDLCLRLPQVEALVAIDAALHLRLTNKVGLGGEGARRLRSLSLLAEPAESPMETRLRWVLRQAGLPNPEVQVDLRDRDGHFLGRADLYYPRACLVIEYDGANHRERLVQDNRRQNLILNAGFRMLRFTAADIKDQPDIVAARVRSALMPHSAPLTPPGQNSHARSAPLDPTRRNWRILSAPLRAEARPSPR